VKGVVAGVLLGGLILAFAGGNAIAADSGAIVEQLFLSITENEPVFATVLAAATALSAGTLEADSLLADPHQYFSNAGQTYEDLLIINTERAISLPAPDPLAYSPGVVSDGVVIAIYGSLDRGLVIRLEEGTGAAPDAPAPTPSQIADQLIDMLFKLEPSLDYLQQIVLGLNEIDKDTPAGASALEFARSATEDYILDRAAADNQVSDALLLALGDFRIQEFENLLPASGTTEPTPSVIALPAPAEPGSVLIVYGYVKTEFAVLVGLPNPPTG
jgi:hypothetical protein